MGLLEVNSHELPDQQCSISYNSIYMDEIQTAVGLLEVNSY